MDKFHSPRGLAMARTMNSIFGNEVFRACDFLWMSDVVRLFFKFTKNNQTKDRINKTKSKLNCKMYNNLDGKCYREFQSAIFYRRQTCLFVFHVCLQSETRKKKKMYHNM